MNFCRSKSTHRPCILINLLSAMSYGIDDVGTLSSESTPVDLICGCALNYLGSCRAVSCRVLSDDMSRNARNYIKERHYVCRVAREVHNVRLKKFGIGEDQIRCMRRRHDRVTESTCRAARSWYNFSTFAIYVLPSVQSSLQPAQR